MRFACLGSGSRGNAWLVEAGSTRVMLDCGFGVRETLQRMLRLGLEEGSLSGLLITHEHADHARGAARFADRHRCGVWLTHGSRVMLESMGCAPERMHEVDGDAVFTIGDLEIKAFPVPHDAREPVQFVVSDGHVRFGMLTDAGHVTEHAVESLSGCQALALECNHDVTMLRQGGYPATLKARILGRYGHLDNASAVALLERMDRSRLRHVMAAHLSEENNTPELARAALAGALDCRPAEIDVADQAAGLGWRDIG